jgi:tetratricopeptide (TPR) repeat protein
MTPEYDVAISFSGEDRQFAQQIADFLTNEFGLLVFYDDYEQAKLWGAYLTERLLSIYRDKSAYCLVLVSKHYKEKRYTMHEWRSAQERAFLTPDKDYLLLVQLDDTRLEGQFETMGYIDGRTTSARTISRLVFEKAGDFSQLATFVRLADQKYREGLYEEALSNVMNSKFDSDIDALRVRANSFAKLRRYKDSVDAFDAIVRIRPQDFLAHFHLGIYCYRLADFSRAVHHYEIADSLSPGHPTIQSDLPMARTMLRAMKFKKNTSKWLRKIFRQ